ncbi:MAG: FtsQ-type POTRA domain-containing protein [Ruminococcus sp.]|nr:FtsQ-type POTRA domain-containing protein [Ruminococcus sp.]
MKRKNKSRREEYEKFDDEAYVNEMLDWEEEHPPKPRKKKRHGVFLGLLTFILGIAIIIFAFLLLFHIQKVEVKGNKYCTQNDIIGWLREDKYAVNSVYVWWKYNREGIEQLPVVESSKVVLKTPWTVQFKVKEKEITGYIDYKNQYLYFDKEGTAVLVTGEKLDGAAYLEGMDVDTSKVKLGEVLPVSDKKVFRGIVELSQLLVRYELTPDSITCVGGGLNLYFGSVEVLLGKTNYGDRIAQIPPILEKLSEQYPDSKGTLHLENYDVSDKAIRFVPEAEEESNVTDPEQGEEEIAAVQP